ncbi:hypothetical protein HPB47_024301 [Ixodes persulcatus]|uniref:Uncharacterized protein n=1 Tax=Ixodes persulcatus TaxID=34615 RepID=A0AC60Q711_IXOPE|nr:hypothetical protein HPB47_024301 [Ixodes persulcatus]
MNASRLILLCKSAVCVEIHHFPSFRFEGIPRHNVARPDYWHRKGEGKSFFCFPSEKFDPNRRAAWVNAVKRAHPTDPRKAWEPSQQSRLCGAHFVTGKPSLDRHHPDHVPTLFAHRKQQPSLGRYERWKNRASTEGTNREHHSRQPSLLQQQYPPRPLRGSSQWLTPLQKIPATTQPHARSQRVFRM